MFFNHFCYIYIYCLIKMTGMVSDGTTMIEMYGIYMVL